MLSLKGLGLFHSKTNKQNTRCYYSLLEIQLGTVVEMHLIIALICRRSPLVLLAYRLVLELTYAHYVQLISAPYLTILIGLLGTYGIFLWYCRLLVSENNNNNNYHLFTTFSKTIHNKTCIKKYSFQINMWARNFVAYFAEIAAISIEIHIAERTFQCKNFFNVMRKWTNDFYYPVASKYFSNEKCLFLSKFYVLCHQNPITPF